MEAQLFAVFIFVCIFGLFSVVKLVGIEESIEEIKDKLNEK